MNIPIEVNGDKYLVRLDGPRGLLSFEDEGIKRQYAFEKITDGFALISGNKVMSVHFLAHDSERLFISLDGDEICVQINDPHILGTLLDKKHGRATQTSLRAIISGLVTSVRIQPGQEIKAGDILFSIEAMKMENLITAPHDCRVRSIQVEEQQSVEAGHVLVTFENT